MREQQLRVCFSKTCTNRNSCKLNRASSRSHRDYTVGNSIPGIVYVYVHKSDGLAPYRLAVGLIATLLQVHQRCHATKLGAFVERSRVLADHGSL